MSIRLIAANELLGMRTGTKFCTWTGDFVNDIGKIRIKGLPVSNADGSRFGWFETTKVLDIKDKGFVISGDFDLRLSRGERIDYTPRWVKQRVIPKDEDIFILVEKDIPVLS